MGNSLFTNCFFLFYFAGLKPCVALQEMPYQARHNGNVERFLKTLKEDFIECSLYEDIADLKEELLGFLVYYNEHRPHSSLGGLTPKEFLEKNNKNVTN